MSDHDRILSFIAAQEIDCDVPLCDCGSSANLCRVTRYLHSEPCCQMCTHEAPA